VSRAKVRRKVSWTAQTIGIVSPVAVQGFIGGPVGVDGMPLAFNVRFVQAISSRQVLENCFPAPIFHD
jgi:hypothetical protein